jgi:formylglycine-generating enzyme required for sulfatase activity
MGVNPSRFQDDPTHPVERVSWDDVQAFIRALNEREASSKYRLPTEAEWEYAARAGSSTAYFFGDDPGQLGDYAWYLDNSDRTTHPVGQLKPNPWGLHDVYGNVWEWVQDLSGNYSKEDVVDPQGPSSNGSSYRIVRGSGWDGDVDRCRSAYRSDDLQDQADNDRLGFRLVREI